MNIFKIQLIFFFLLNLSFCIFFHGCTNIEKNECKKTYWPSQGFEDGQEGRPSRLSMFLTKCSPFHVTVDNQAYLEGYDKGLDLFCSEDSAFSRGFQGLTPENVCENNAKYKTGYELGVQNFCSEEIGTKDATEGKAINPFCKAKGKYSMGYQKSLKSFCTQDTGYKLGLEGKPITNICKKDVQKSFQMGYQNGRKEFLKTDTKRIQTEIVNAEKQLTLIKDNFTKKTKIAFEFPTDSKDVELNNKKVKLDQEIQLLKESKSKLEQDIFDLQKLINKNNVEISQMDNK